MSAWRQTMMIHQPELPRAAADFQHIAGRWYVEVFKYPGV